MIFGDLCGFGKSVFRPYCSVSPYFKNQFVIVVALPCPSRLDGKLYLFNRREDRVYGNGIENFNITFVNFWWHITAAKINLHFQTDIGVFHQSHYMLAVWKHFNLPWTVKIIAFNFAPALPFIKQNILLNIVGKFKAHLLKVVYNFQSILNNVWNCFKFAGYIMNSSVGISRNNLYRSNGISLNWGKKNPA